ncbi:MAG: hypothetical protein ABSE77_00925 [Acidimicrobiales bacterium]
MPSVPSVPTVLVSRQGDGAYAVRVRGPKSETSHVVSVPAALAQSLGLSDLPGEELVRASFAFLLDREPAGSILPRFSLESISRYFPEYSSELRNYLAYWRDAP